MLAPNVALQVAVAAANQNHSGPPPTLIQVAVATWISGTMLVVLGCLAMSIIAYLEPKSKMNQDGARKARLVLLVSWAWPVIVAWFLAREVVMALQEVWGFGVAKWRQWFPHREADKPGPDRGAYRSKGKP